MDLLFPDPSDGVVAGVFENAESKLEYLLSSFESIFLFYFSFFLPSDSLDRTLITSACNVFRRGAGS